ncbi:MAG: DUF86 domain-containing protein [Rothia sp. (in: high G+C Gram-positive bacteria)]|uniref:HepT-like ribonuclease domain-containing protein n=1 Tax=Rothia sp. (in: high G+C Gram-positive bacteria) TaxID=1885016 RepID=UPI0026DFFDCA|nr:HepT-like ribonuclease domain-containing protein [Rothia sp. (in: high G+C Gram-positive bacteria)]MDO5750674.1 DUF86 domain-containing protein [Rothia sp. (in: high G+C Gram-positive bacteria)]
MNKSPNPHGLLAITALERVLMYAPDTYEEFESSLLVQDAIAMRLQEAGENLSKVRRNFPEFFTAHATQDWVELIGVRNIISHGYDGLDSHSIWLAIQEDVPRTLDGLRQVFHTE